MIRWRRGCGGMATLDELVTGLRYKILSGVTSCTLTGITADSRKVKPGWAFVAIPGSKVDGHAFIHQALAQGARVLVIDRAIDVAPMAAVTCLVVPDNRQAIAHLVAAFYCYTSVQLRLVGLMGTH